MEYLISFRMKCNAPTAHLSSKTIKTNIFYHGDLIIGWVREWGRESKQHKKTGKKSNILHLSTNLIKFPIWQGIEQFRMISMKITLITIHFIRGRAFSELSFLFRLYLYIFSGPMMFCFCFDCFKSRPQSRTQPKIAGKGTRPKLFSYFFWERDC